jgi:hypothetical protein
MVRPFEMYRCVACSQMWRVPADPDEAEQIVIYRRVRRSGEVRWLLTQGNTKICDTADKFDAIMQGCALARSYTVDCFVSDGGNVRHVDCSRFHQTTSERSGSR